MDTQQIWHQGGWCPLPWGALAWPHCSARDVVGNVTAMPEAPTSCCTFSRPCWRPDSAVARMCRNVEPAFPGEGSAGLVGWGQNSTITV